MKQWAERGILFQLIIILATMFLLLTSLQVEFVLQASRNYRIFLASSLTASVEQIITYHYLAQMQASVNYANLVI